MWRILLMLRKGAKYSYNPESTRTRFKKVFLLSLQLRCCQFKKIQMRILLAGRSFMPSCANEVNTKRQMPWKQNMRLTISESFMAKNISRNTSEAKCTVRTRKSKCLKTYSEKSKKE